MGQPARNEDYGLGIERERSLDREDEDRLWTELRAIIRTLNFLP